ncbi:endolytic transglycosylase MltG [uncultured Robinsoniella sp.]|uniref:endolytic transglycosylase MltG n=1 Tax=uncultured Robinsoniella sp. TaxID=904190 RepID=UPI00374EA8A3
MNAKKVVLSITMTCVKMVILVLIVYALFVFGRHAYDFGFQVFAGESISDPPGKEVAVTITEDMSVMEIAELLKNKGLIKDAKVFWVQEKLSKYSGKLKKGNYILTTAQDADEMLEELAQETEAQTEE